jgi:hypothetical protein
VINVRGIANAAIQVVNQNIAATYRASTGSTTDAAGKRTPTYAANVSVQIQAQAAKGSDLKHVQNLNVQSVYKNVRMWGDTQGVVRPDAKGGDLLLFPNVPAGTVHTWLVVAVLETWPEWCSVIACLQTDPAMP